MDMQIDFSDLCMLLTEKFGDDPKICPSARMLLDYSLVRWVKIGMSLAKTGVPVGKDIDWEAMLERFSKRILSAGEPQKGNTTGMVWPGHPGAAWMCARGLAKVSDEVIAAADSLLEEGHRDPDGLFDDPVYPGHLSTVHLAMTVPFLAWAGKIGGQARYFDEAVKQFTGYAGKLYDPAARLWHPGFLPGKANAAMTGGFWDHSCMVPELYPEKVGVYPGCWGSGEGYALFALSELIFELPDGHEAKQKLLGMRVDMLEGLLGHQDPNGMWHQVLNDWGSYPETSGTAWILYAMGRGVKKGTVDREKFLPPYLHGLAGMARYLAYDGSIFNGSASGFCPGGRGTAVDYATIKWYKDESFAVAPVLLALQQAVQNECAMHLIPSFGEVMNQFTGE